MQFTLHLMKPGIWGKAFLQTETRQTNSVSETVVFIAVQFR
jgi:hypothetical protein